MRGFLLGVMVQFISYFNLTLNYRAISAGLVPYAMATDALAVVISIFIVKRLSGSTVPWTSAETGMVVGGSLAAWAGIQLTRTWG